MVCSAYLATFIQTETSPFRSPECTHSSSTQALPLLSLSLSHSLSLFIYLRVCLATAPQCEALQQWVNLPPYWWEMEGQMMLSDCRQGEGLKRFSSENHCFLLRWGHRGQVHDVIWSSNFMGPYYLWELLICRHLKCCETELFHTLPLLLCPSSLPHSSLLVCEAWDIWIISWSAATHKAGLSSWSEWV